MASTYTIQHLYAITLEEGGSHITATTPMTCDHATIHYIEDVHNIQDYKVVFDSKLLGSL